MRQFKFNYFLAIFLAVFTILYSAKVVSAHGDSKKLEVDSIPIGNASLSVWSTPSILRPGEIHFISAILDEQNIPVTDCAITVRVTSGVDASVTEAVAVAPPDLPEGGAFEAQFELENAGIYHVEVEVLEPDNQVYLSNFDIQVVSVSLLAKLIIQFQVGLSFVIGAWLLQRGLVIFGIWRPAPVVSRQRIRS